MILTGVMSFRNWQNPRQSPPLPQAGGLVSKEHLGYTHSTSVANPGTGAGHVGMGEVSSHWNRDPWMVSPLLSPCPEQPGSSVSMSGFELSLSLPRWPAWHLRLQETYQLR